MPYLTKLWRMRSGISCQLGERLDTGWSVTSFVVVSSPLSTESALLVWRWVCTVELGAYKKLPLQFSVGSAYQASTETLRFDTHGSICGAGVYSYADSWSGCEVGS